jgi:AraC family transcriptional regulator
MQSQPVPVTMGTERFRSLETDSYRVTEAWFPAGSVLEPHTHERAIFAVMLRGGFRTRMAHRTLACDPGCAWTEPLGEKHANYVGAHDAHVVVVQPAPGNEALLRPIARLLDGIHLLRESNVVTYALRMLAEVRAPDDLSALSLEGLATLLLADCARVEHRQPRSPRVPPWLLRAREILHDEWRRGLTVSQIAATVKVHPAYLTRSFRRYFGQTMGSYARRLRIEWAVRQLAFADRPISHIACAAGFSDQSHFTRECRRLFGLTPGEYRSRVATGEMPCA